VTTHVSQEHFIITFGQEWGERGSNSRPQDNSNSYETYALANCATTPLCQKQKTNIQVNMYPPWTHGAHENVSRTTGAICKISATSSAGGESELLPRPVTACPPPCPGSPVLRPPNPCTPLQPPAARPLPSQPPHP
jgi:hypothetical protein